MDLLVQHCLQELSYDGDFGCSVSRWPTFISNFYSSSSSKQIVDDDFVSYVWSLVVRQPGTRVGLIPVGVPAVWVAPQVSKQSKATITDDADREFEPIEEDFLITPLAELKQKYGDRLHIAADQKTTFAILTGSYSRPSKLTGMAYTALQLITRSRDKGIPVDDITKTTGYSSGTVFYLVKVLTELNLVLKLRTAGLSMNIAIHRSFWERSPAWQHIRSEELKAEEELKAPVTPPEPEEEDDFEALDADSDDEKVAPLPFTPVDSRFLSSAPLVKGRIVKLLKHAKNGLHIYTNLLLSIGCVNPSRTDRRFFIVRVRELMRERVIEKVFVPSRAIRGMKKGTSADVLCVRLVTENGESSTGATSRAEEDVGDAEVAQDSENLPLWNVTIHRQLVGTLEDAGQAGMTLNSISERLGNFDKRTIEHLLFRFTRDLPPPHLVDLGVAENLQHYGRERRHEYWTIPSLRSLFSAEGLTADSTDKFDTVMNLDLSLTGGFGLFEESDFYDGDDEFLRQYVDSFSRFLSVSTAKNKKRKNPIRPDGTITIGRPRKDWSLKRKADEGDADSSALAEPPKKRVRSRKKNNPLPGEEELPQPTPKPKPRGRRKRQTDPEEESADVPTHHTADDTLPEGERPPTPVEATAPDKSNDDSSGVPSSETQKRTRARKPPKAVDVGKSSEPKKRGRPRKTAEVLPPAQEASASVVVEPISEAQNDVPMEESPIQPTKGVRRSTRKVKETVRYAPKTPKASKKAKTVDPDPETGHPDHSPVVSGSGGRGLSMPIDEEVNAAPMEEARAAQTDHDVIEHTEVETRDSDLRPTAAKRGADDIGSTHPAKKVRISIEDEPIEVTGVDVTQLTQIEADPTLEGPEVPTEPTKNKAKKAKAPKNMNNVTSMRRASEFMRVLRELGGTANLMTQEFQDSHARLLIRLVAAKETTSAPPGTLIDKRTMRQTIDVLENRGELKKTTVMVRTPNGAPKPCVAIYLPDIDREVLNQYLASLEGILVYHPPGLPKLSSALDFQVTVNHRGNAVHIISNAAKQIDWAGLKRDKLEGAQDLEEVRKILFEDPRVIAQYSGYIIGRFARAREVHMFVTSQMDDPERQSSHFVSSADGILETTYLWSGLPIGIYCSIVTTSIVCEPLSEFLSYEDNRWTPCKDIPNDLQDLLALGRAKTRRFIRELLALLTQLKIITPLMPSTSSNPLVTCPANLGHPTSYDRHDDETMMPLYFMFNHSAPIYLFRESETEQPFICDHPLLSGEERWQFWQLLHQASDTGLKLDGPITPLSDGTPFSGPIEFIRSIRRGASWISTYVLSAMQIHFLTSLVDPATTENPLDKGDNVLSDLCDITGAPPDTIKEFLEKKVRAAKRALDNIRKRSLRKQTLAEQRREARRILADKVSEAKQRAEKDWIDLLRSLQLFPLSSEDENRLSAVHQQFLNSGGRLASKQGLERLNEEIFWALKEAPRRRPGPIPAQVSARLRLASKNVTMPIHLTPKFKVSDKTVYELIEEQQPRPAEVKRVKKKKKKKDIDPPVETEEPDHQKPKAQRFQWNEDYDELARDAGAIITVRCRQHYRPEWASLVQVFPGAARNGVRARISRLMRASKAYSDRLEAAWEELWIKHRGTDELPDPNPDSLSEFDLPAYITFLRQHVDKNTLRAGLNITTETLLPETVTEVFDEYVVTSLESNSQATFDFLFDMAGDETREKPFRVRPFVLPEDSSEEPGDGPPVELSFAKSLIKMVLSTPEPAFDESSAQKLLEQISPVVLNTAKRELRKEDVLASVVPDSTKPRPGSAFRYQDWQGKAIYGPIPNTIYRDAVEFENEILQNDDGGWSEWSLLANDGDTAAFLQLVSENKLDILFDLPDLEASKSASAGNSRKIGDEDLECNISFRLREEKANPMTISPSVSPAVATVGLPSVSDNLPPETDVHGIRYDGYPAACHLSPFSVDNEGLINCQACLEASRGALSQNSPTRDANEDAESLLRCVEEAGPGGLSKKELINQSGFDSPHVNSLLKRMTSTPVPLLFWCHTPYSSMLIAAKFISSWAVHFQDHANTAEGNEAKMSTRLVFPRRWLDMNGRVLKQLWEAAIKAVIGWIWNKPRITEWNLLDQLKLIYDRAEVIDILKFLAKEGQVNRLLDAELEREPQFADPDDLDIGATNEYEAKRTYWMVSSSGVSWYRV